MLHYFFKASPALALVVPLMGSITGVILGKILGNNAEAVYRTHCTKDKIKN